MLANFVNRTSQQAYEEYQKLSEIEEKLAKKNKGMNLLNADIINQRKRYHVKIFKTVHANLTKHWEHISVETNLCCHYSLETTPEKLLSELKAWVSIPRYKPFIQRVRRRDNRVGEWRMADFETEFIRFEDIEFSIGEVASKDFDLEKFKKEVHDILQLQREATKEEAKDFEEYWLLFQKVEDLSRQIVKESSYGYSYSYRKSRFNDDTPQFTIGYKEYNRQLRWVAVRLKALHKKYSFLSMPQMSFYNEKKPITLRQFKKEQLQELEEGWETVDKEQYDGDFNAYCKAMFDDFANEESVQVEEVDEDDIDDDSDLDEDMEEEEE